MNKLQFSWYHVISFIVLFYMLGVFSFKIFESNEKYTREMTVTKKNVNKWYINGVDERCDYIFSDGNREWHLRMDYPSETYDKIEIGGTYIFICEDRLDVLELVMEIENTQ